MTLRDAASSRGSLSLGAGTGGRDPPPEQRQTLGELGANLGGSQRLQPPSADGPPRLGGGAAGWGGDLGASAQAQKAEVVPVKAEGPASCRGLSERTPLTVGRISGEGPQGLRLVLGLPSEPRGECGDVW